MATRYSVSRLATEAVRGARGIFEKVSFDWKVDRRSVKDVYEMLQKGLLYIDPEMQRGYVWDEVTASQFIESLIMGAPVPPIMVLEEEVEREVEVEEKGKKTKRKEKLKVWTVVDGVQRLTTIRLFLENKLRLRDVLTPALEGKTYEKLDPALRERLLHMSTVPLMVIKLSAPDAKTATLAKLEVFRRINLGAKRLTLMQVLICACREPAIQAIRELRRHPSFNEVFAPNEKEVAQFTDYKYATAMYMTLAQDDIVLTISRRDYIEKLVSLSESEARKVLEDAKKILDVFAAAKISRQFFAPKQYNLKKNAKPAIPLISLLTLAFAQVMEKTKLDKDVAASRATDIQKTIITTLVPDIKLMVDKHEVTFATAYGEIRSRADVARKALRILAEKLADEIAAVAKAK